MRPRWLSPYLNAVLTLSFRPDILKGLFKNRGLYEILAVEDGQHAVDTFPTFRPDVTLMDMCALYFEADCVYD